MTAPIVVAVLTIYPITVGLAARLIRWVFKWDLGHDPKWSRDNDGLHPRCGDREYGDTVRCPGCSHRLHTWILAALYPATLPLLVIGKMTLDIGRTIVKLAIIAGPNYKELGP